MSSCELTSTNSINMSEGSAVVKEKHLYVGGWRGSGGQGLVFDGKKWQPLIWK